MFQPLARMLWESVEATLVDQRHIKSGYYSSDGGGRTNYQVFEYMLDVPLPDGSSVRLTTEEKSFWLPNAVQPGDRIPVLVNKKHSKVEIDRKAISDHTDSVRQAREAVTKARDEARFKAKLEGQGEEATARSARAAEDQALADIRTSPDVAEVIEAEVKIDRELEDQMKEDERFLDEHGGP